MYAEATMMAKEDTMVKTTIRLPEHLHLKLRQIAITLGRSLNQVIIDNLQVQLSQPQKNLSEEERITEALLGTGLIAQLGKEWDDLIKKDVDRDELYNLLSSKMVGKPISEIIIEDRG